MLKFNKHKKSEARLLDPGTGSDRAPGKRDKSPRYHFFPFRHSHHPAGGTLLPTGEPATAHPGEPPAQPAVFPAPKLSLDETALGGPDLPSDTEVPFAASLPPAAFVASPPAVVTSRPPPSDARPRRKPKEAKPAKSRGLGMFSGWSGKKHADKSTGAPPLELSSSSESLRGVPLRKATRHRGVPVFGAEITAAAEATQLDDDLPLPAVVVRCIEYLDDQGLYEVGLYRIPGSSSRVARLRATFDKGRDLDLEQSETDPHSVATLLKLYLRELPSAALTDALLPAFNAVPNPPASDHGDQADRDYQVAQHLAWVAQRLPDANYYLFHWLCRHLARLDYYSDINKMTLSNLGLIFCPTLRVKSYVFRAFITQSDVVFPLPRRTFSDEPPSSAPLPVPAAAQSAEELVPATRAPHRRGRAGPLSAHETSPHLGRRSTGTQASYDDLDLPRMSQVYDPDVILRTFTALRQVTEATASPEALPPHLAHLEHLTAYATDHDATPPASGTGEPGLGRTRMTRSQRRRGIFILQPQAPAEDTDDGELEGEEIAMVEASMDRPDGAGTDPDDSDPFVDAHSVPPTPTSSEEDLAPVSPVIPERRSSLAPDRDGEDGTDTASPSVPPPTWPQPAGITPAVEDGDDGHHEEYHDGTEALLPMVAEGEDRSGRYRFLRSLSPFAASGGRSAPEVPVRTDSLGRESPYVPRRSSKRRPALPLSTMQSSMPPPPPPPHTAPLVPTNFGPPSAPLPGPPPVPTKKSYNPFHNLATGIGRLRDPPTSPGSPPPS